MEIKTIAGVCIVKDARLLLLQQGNGNSHDLWGPPAGHGEDGETLEETAIRETKEESGLSVELTGIIQSGLYRASDGNNYLIVLYSGQAEDLNKLAVDNVEIKDHSWVNLEDLNSGKYKLRHPILSPILKRSLTENPLPLKTFIDQKIKV